MKKYRFDSIAISLFIIIAGIFYYPTIFYRKLPVPTDTLVGLYHPFRDLYAETNPRGVPFKNFLITDPVRQHIPWRKIVIESWKRGERPALNPYTFTGVPLDANIQAAPYYPLNIFFLLFDFPNAWTLLIMLQPILAGVFLYLFLRHHSISVIASCIGALSWAFGGFATAWMTWGTIMHTALWLPLILLAIDALLIRNKTKKYVLGWSVCLGLALMMTFFGGHMQIAFYVYVLSIVYFTWRIKSLNNHSVLRWVIPTLGAVILITAVQWSPFMRFLSESGRAGALDAWKTTGWFLPWQHLVQFLAPDFFGNPATLNYWGVWNYGEFIGYIGLIPLLFAMSTFRLTGVPRFFVGMATLSIFFMLPHPLSRFPFQLHIPIISVLQPTRLMVLVDFSLAILAAFGFDHFLKGNLKQAKKTAVVFGLGLVVLWVFVLGVRIFVRDIDFLGNLAVAKRNLVIPAILFTGFLLLLGAFQWVKQRRFKRLVLGLLFVIIVFDLLRFGWKFTPFTPREYFFPATKVIRFLQNQPKPFRVMSLDDRILPPNTSTYYGIESIEGYDPIAPRSYEDFLVASERGKADISKPTGFNRIYTAHNVDSPLLPYFNVRYVLSLVDVDRPFLREIMREGETRVYEYMFGLPRAYLADIAVISETPGETLSKLIENKALRLGVYNEKVDIAHVPLSSTETADIITYVPNKLLLKVSAERGKRLLVILNRFDNRWTAKIDSIPVALFPVNYLFMGLVVPSGVHDVILSYH